ncbi:hypothetical protein IMCC1989_780 [gamma proteobacterium IMCC1989]|nr:hypothetical protein IMCC1989_780 [gamma proteobacterium IMCC1989]
MKKTLLALAIAGAAVSAQADVSISGQVNYTMGDTEDFTNDEGFEVNDGNNSSSRFRFIASTEANGITYGARQEWNVGGGNGANPSVRVNEFSIAGDFGKFRLGTGWESGDDVTEIDFSGTYIAGSGAGGYIVGGTSTDNIDGGRDQRLRYDSPKLGGVVNIIADYDEADSFGLAVLAGGDNWGAGIFTEQAGDAAHPTSQGTAGDATTNGQKNTDEIGGSVAVKVAGFTASLQMGKADNSSLTDAGEAKYRAVILGYNVGKTSFAIHTENRTVDNAAGTKTVDNTSNGVSFAYRPTGGVELYAGFRTAKSKLSDKTVYQNGTSDKGTGFVVGGVVRF